MVEQHQLIENLIGHYLWNPIYRRYYRRYYHRRHHCQDPQLSGDLPCTCADLGRSGRLEEQFHR